MTPETPKSESTEKPASEMSVEELQALLQKKQEQEAPSAETEADTSYLEMATAEQAPRTPEENAELAERITEAETILKDNTEELQATASEADAAFAQAEAALEEDPHAVGPKLVLEKIRDAFERINDKLTTITGGLLIGGLLGGGGGMIMIDQGKQMIGTDQDYVSIANNVMSGTDWASLGEQMMTASTWGSLAAIGATFAVAKLAKKFQFKRANSKYFSQS